MLGTDEPQSEKEAAEGILFIIHSFLFGGDPLLIPSHLTELADEHLIGGQFFRCGHLGEPGEGHLFLRNRNGQAVHTQGFLDQATLGGQDSSKVFQAAVGEPAARQGNVDLGGFLFILGVALVNVEALVIDVLKKPLDYHAVGSIIKDEAAVFLDSEVIDLVSKGWGSQVCVG